MSFLEPVSLIPLRPTRTIGDIRGYITISEEGIDKLTITKHPVQQGASITDHAYKEPTELNIQIVRGGILVDLNEVYQEFLDLQNSRVPFDVITNKRAYSNMLISAIRETTDKKTENIISMSLSLTEIIIVEVTPVNVPPRARQSNPGNTGATEKGGKKSALKVLSEGIGNLIGG